MAGKFIKSTGLVALAATLALGVQPASAQDQGRRWPGTEAQRGGDRSSVRDSFRNNQARAPQAQPQAGAQPPVQQGLAQGAGAPRRAWPGERTRNPPPAVVAQAPAARQVEQQRNSQWQANRGDRDGIRDRNGRDGRDGIRDRNDRDGGRNGNWRDGRRDDRPSIVDSFRNNRGRVEQNNRQWNRDWRRDNRYNWNSYRNTNRNVYRVDRYYAPYRNYSYRRIGIGFGLDSLFFGSRYWINDPWQYRLPPAYGAYRWVRYYDDVVLVDTYTGRVVDVIYDFFW